jgi:hypothetical protein
MKQIFLLIFLLGCGFSGISQNSKRINDPTYSTHNYKHPNKAAYAKEHNLDNSTFLETSSVARNDNYKQPNNKPMIKSSGVGIQSTKPSRDRRNQSYKHPFGL